MAVLQDATGLGRGSLYNFFPGGKDEMAQAVLEDIDDWFQLNVFGSLRAASGGNTAEARTSVAAMFTTVDNYFQSGQRVCLPGAFAVGRERDRFAIAVSAYFVEWIEVLTAALVAMGHADARAIALRTIAAVQGGIVLARALSDNTAFTSVLSAARAEAIL
ncbi:AcrR family transcriptional regulator [Leucobacter exalbidus]|uniref:AcrR family transcriptional regulator n=2 Tax=Leucobacter exalbidus TaxID=662960 RepID=A0A940PY97_9MICO|nr:AcrR family transcriptional regulator [Leucobacter exalbidus]